MKTVGEILKKARERKDVSLEEVVAATKIKKEFLEAIEKSDFQKFSSEVVARGLVKNYAEFLDVPSRSALSIFKRDFKVRRSREVIPKEIVKTINRSKLNWSPKTTLISVVSAAFIALLSYLGYQYFSLVKNPSLELFQPQENQQILTKKVEVIGRADPDSTVTINGELVSLSPKGEFHFTLILLPGENKIVVEATNRLGKTRKEERTVFIVSSRDS